MYIYTQVVDLSAVSGDDFDIPLQFTTGNLPNTIPLNITGWTIEFLIKKQQTDPDSSALVNQTITNHLDPVNGITAVLNNQTVTATLSGRYYYYFRWYDNQGNRQTFLYGRINFII